MIVAASGTTQKSQRPTDNRESTFVSRSSQIKVHGSIAVDAKPASCAIEDEASCKHDRMKFLTDLQATGLQASDEGKSSLHHNFHLQSKEGLQDLFRDDLLFVGLGSGKKWWHCFVFKKAADAASDLVCLHDLHGMCECVCVQGT